MIVRLIAAVALLVSAGDHYRLWSDGGKHLHIVGPLFLVQAVAGVVVAALLIFWKSWLAPLAAVLLAGGTLLGFVIATMPSGLVGDHEKWVGNIVWVAAITEVIAIVAGLVALAQERRSAPLQQHAAARS